jgi:hypothetical protein
MMPEMTTQTPSDHLLFSNLTQSIRSGECVAIIGAGMSYPAYPLWNELAQFLKVRCVIGDEDFQKGESNKAPLDIAEAASRKSKERYFEALNEFFASSRDPEKKRISEDKYHLLARIKFASYLTLNFDPLLVDTLHMHRNVVVSSYDDLQDRHNGKGELFHIHGRLGPDNPALKAKIVLTRSEFKKAYKPGSFLSTFLRATFLHHDVCFIGCNPMENNIKKILKACEAFCVEKAGLAGPRKNWFLLWDDVSAVPEKKLSKCGVQIVGYPRKSESFQGFDEILQYWAEKKPVQFREIGKDLDRSDTGRVASGNTFNDVEMQR